MEKKECKTCKYNDNGGCYKFDLFEAQEECFITPYLYEYKYWTEKTEDFIKKHEMEIA